MREVTFHWDDGDECEINVDITVSRATMLMGAERLKLVSKAEAYLTDKQNKYLDYVVKVADGQIKGSRDALVAEGSDVDFGLWLVCSNYYPACIAGTVKIENAKSAKIKLTTSMSFDDFLNLDEELVSTWFTKVMALNPHWNAFRAKKDDDQGEAKAPATADG